MLFGSLKDGGAVEIDVDSGGIKLKVKENAFQENY
jgi:dihydroxyacid dehydratase/phosphogluconate dehydratase